MLTRTILALLLIGGAAACGSDDTGSTTTTTSSSTTVATTTTVPSDTTTGALPADLEGTFAAVIDPADVELADQAGFWWLTFSATDGYSLGHVPDTSPENSGDLTIDGDEFAFSDEGGHGACPGTGTYTWALDGDTLTMTTVDEGCDIRSVQNTVAPYVRCPAGPDSCVEPG